MPDSAQPARPAPLARRAAPAGPLLADHDERSLAELLARAGAAPSAARVAARRAIRHVFPADRDAPAAGPDAPQDAPPTARWDAGALAALEIGAWAHPALLALSPDVSLSVAEIAPSSDETVRLVLRARDGALIEAVVIPGPARATLCLSSQVGCARACTDRPAWTVPGWPAPRSADGAHAASATAAAAKESEGT